jgi:hypothetical protein
MKIIYNIFFLQLKCPVFSTERVIESYKNKQKLVVPRTP